MICLIVINIVINSMLIMFSMVIITPTINLEKQLYDTIVRSGRDATKYTNESVRNALDTEIAVKKEQPK